MYFNKELIGKRVKVDKEGYTRLVDVDETVMTFQGMCVSEGDACGIISDSDGNLYLILTRDFKFVNIAPRTGKEISPMEEWINILTKNAIEFSVEWQDKDGLNRIIINGQYSPEGCSKTVKTEIWFDDVGEFRCIGAWE